jgi:hypothetical protein
MRGSDIPPQKPVTLFVDCDDVISKSSKWPRLMGICCLLFNYAKKHPINCLCLLPKIPFLLRKGQHLAQQPHMTRTLIIDTLLHDLESKGFNDISSFREDIIELSVNPQPIADSIQLLKNLKHKGHMLVGATNQDYVSHTYYRKALRQQGIDLDALFDATLTTYSPSNCTPPFEPFRWHNELTSWNRLLKRVPVDLQRKIFMADQGIEKPLQDYYSVAGGIAASLDSSIHTRYLIDDRKENIDGAQVKNIKGLWLKLVNEKGDPISARRAGTKKITEAISAIKKQLVNDKLL